MSKNTRKPDTQAHEKRQNELNIIRYYSDIVGLIDNTGKIKIIHTPTEESEDQYLAGQSITKKVHQNDIEEFKQHKKVVVTQDNIDKSGTYRIQTNNNEWKLFDMNFRSGDHFDHIDEAIVTAENISGQYYFLQRRQVVNRVLRHDIRTKMNVMLGKAEMVQNNPNNTELVIEQSKEITDCARDVVDISDEVRELDRELNKLDRRVREVNMQQVISQVVEEYHPQNPNAVFKQEIEENCVIGTSMISNAISHLIENALEHARESDGTLEIKISTMYNPNTNRTEVIVEDNGEGIDSGEADIITSGLETPLNHTGGLGLWIVKWVAKSVGGDFNIAPRQPTGTKAVMSLHHPKNTPKDKTFGEMKEAPHEYIREKLKEINDPSTDISTTTRFD